MRNIDFDGFIVQTGGTYGALDNFSPSDKDMAIGMVGGKLLSYQYSSTNGTTADGVNFIQPISVTGAGRWVLQTNAPSWTWEGAWVSGNNYNVWDIVTDSTGAYICTYAITNSLVTPATDTNHFALMVSVGATGTQGQQGQPGTNGSNGTNGQGFLWRGLWVTGHNYALYDVTTDANGVYGCISAITNSTTTPSSDATHFTLMAAIGPQGIQGVQGVAGPQGPGINVRGAWASGQNYATSDTVSYSSNVYICMVAITNSTTSPNTDTTHFTLLGAQGAAGSTGAIGATGPQGPTGASGSNGANGTNGTNGTNGLNGNTWWFGTTAPGSVSGSQQGDWYLNTTNSNVYIQTATLGTWTLQGNIQGQQGATGVTGATGETGETGATGTAGVVGGTSTVTAAGTTTLTSTSYYIQLFTGTTTQTVVLPVATTLTAGWSVIINNQSTGIVTVKTSGNNTIQAMVGVPSSTYNSVLTLVCINPSGGTGTASWTWEYRASGTFNLTGVGFSGTVTIPADFVLVNRMVVLRIQYFDATSNSTSFSLTGIPSVIQPSVQVNYPLFQATDNTAPVNMSSNIFTAIAADTIYFYKSASLTGWTATGTKGTTAGTTWSYRL